MKIILSFLLFLYCSSLLLSQAPVIGQESLNKTKKYNSYLKLEVGYFGENVNFSKKYPLNGFNSKLDLKNLNLIYGRVISPQFRIEGMLRYWSFKRTVYNQYTKSKSPKIETGISGQFKTKVLTFMVYPKYTFGKETIYSIGLGMGMNTYFKKELNNAYKWIDGQDGDFIRIQKAPNISGTQVAFVYGFNLGIEFPLTTGKISINYQLDKNIPILLNNTQELYINDRFTGLLLGLSIPLS